MTVLRVLVAGAGAVGSMLALRLARAGARVVLADPAPVGRNASGVAAGMMAPVFESLLDPSPGEFDLLMRARSLWPEVARGTGVALDRSGAMAVGTEAEVEAWRRAMHDLGVAGEVLDPPAARRRSPWLVEGLSGLWTGEDWRLDSLHALGAIQAAAVRDGAVLRRAGVAAFGAGKARLSDGERLDVDILVVATGWTRGLEGVAPEVSAVSPIKGHILRARGLQLAGPAVRFAGGYICPDPNGAVIGATMEPGRSDDRVDPSSIQLIRERAARAHPDALVMAVEAAVGVRGATPDRRPLVGPSATPGVWLAVGARRNGWLLAPLMAERVKRALVDDVVDAL